MPLLHANKINIYVEDSGTGTPIIFIHELGGDHRSWHGQVDELSRSYRCITYAARGYLPSDIPNDDADYGWQTSIDDLIGILDALDIETAFLVGLSMGAYTAVMAALQHPDRVSGVIFASGGSGSHEKTREKFSADAYALANHILETGSTDLPAFFEGPSRVQLQNKDREAWLDFTDQFREHSSVGTAMTLRYVQAVRPSLYDFESELAAMTVPMLIIAGDEDEHVLDASLWLKRTMPYAGLSVFPKSGHIINLEESQAFNRHVREFLTLVEGGLWSRRDPRSEAALCV